MRRSASFSNRLFILIAGVTIATLLIAFTASSFILVTGNRNEMKANAISQATFVAEMSSATLLFEQVESASSLLQTLETNIDVVSAVLYRFTEGRLEPFATYRRAGEETGFEAIASADVAPLLGAQRASFDGNRLRVSVPVLIEGASEGVLRLEVSLESFNDRLQRTGWVLFAVALGALLVAFFLARLARKSMLVPIRDLVVTMNEIGDTKDYSQRANLQSEDEFGRLVDSFNNMLSVIQEFDDQRQQKEVEIEQMNEVLEEKIRFRTHELETSLKSLSKTLEELQLTQEKLVEQEKLASLGGLVAGVAHEINTPVGVAITAATHLEQSLIKLKQLYDSGNLTESAFTEGVADLDSSVSMVLRNLERAAAQVRSFKMVAVDQSSHEERQFNLKEYVDAVIVSLTPRLRNTRHLVSVDIDESISIYSYPGVFSQILTNLILNSVIHGFKHEEQGVIDIQAEIRDGVLTLDYFDNGCGVPESVRDRVFDPFVTTNREGGGSGLGTHILYNLVTQALHGEILFDKSRTTGVHFKLSIPLRREN